MSDLILQILFKMSLKWNLSANVLSLLSSIITSEFSWMEQGCLKSNTKVASQKKPSGRECKLE